MQSTTSSSLIDPTDSNVTLTDMLDTEQKFLETCKQKSFQDEKRDLVYVKPIAWMILNGYLPRNDEWSIINGKRKLENWKPGHMYLNTRYLEKQEMPPYPHDLPYSNIYGQDLEYDLEAWEHTTDFINMKDNHRTKMVEMIYTEALNHYKMENFPATDKGPLGPLIRLQDMFTAAQCRVIAAGPQLEETIAALIKIIPRDSDGIRNQEALMRKLITLEERARYGQIGSRDTHWAALFTKGLLCA